MRSQNSSFRFEMQADGNLVVYNSNRRALWATRTWGNPGAYADMRSDGNLVVYSKTGTALWGARTNGNPGARVCMQNDGNLVIYSSTNAPLWATMTYINPERGQLITYNNGLAGQCTWGAQYMVNWYTSGAVYMDTRSGNALVWGRNAQAHGWPVGTTPRIGSMVVFQPNIAGAFSAGHVAFVTQYYPSTNSIRVREMNMPTGNGWAYRTISPAIDTGIAATGRPNIEYVYLNP